MIITQGNMADLFKGFRILYDDSYQAAKPRWSEIAQEIPSTVNEQVYAWLGAFPGMKRLVGAATINKLIGHRYSIFNEEFEDTIEVKEADIENDQYGLYNPRFTALGDVAAYHPDELVAALLCNGFNADALDYTATPFFAVDKVRIKGDKGKFTNKGTKKLSIENFEAARANIKSRKNAEGRSMGLGRKLVLIVGTGNESLGKQILQADFVMQTAANTGTIAAAAAVTNVNKGSAELMVWPLIDTINPDMWFLLEVGLPGIRPIIHQINKKPVLLSCNNPQDSFVLQNHKFLYQAYGRYNAGYGLPELAYGSTGADAA